MNSNQDKQDDDHSDVLANVIFVVAKESDLPIEDRVLELVNRPNSKTSALEDKLDRMNDMLLEQQNTLKTLIDSSVIFNCNKNGQTKDSLSGSEETTGSSQENKSSRCLLDDIELKLTQSLHHELKVAIESFLQSEELKNSVAKSTVECLKSEINRNLAETLQYCFMTMSENYHDMLLDSIIDLISDYFSRLGDDSYLIKSLQNASRSIWNALTKHQTFMESSQPPHNVMKKLQENLESILKRELEESKKSLMNALKSQMASSSNSEKIQPTNCMPVMPPKPYWNIEKAQYLADDMSSRQSQLTLSPVSSQAMFEDFVPSEASKSNWNLGKTQSTAKYCMEPNSIRPNWEIKVSQYLARHEDPSPGPSAPVYNPVGTHNPHKDNASTSCEPLQKLQPTECSMDIVMQSADKAVVYRKEQSITKTSNPVGPQYPVVDNKPPSPSQSGPLPPAEGAKDSSDICVSSSSRPSYPKVTNVIEKMFKAAHIKAMIEKGDVEQAFCEALGCDDLSLVESACRAADPQRVFAAPCCLKQPTLLSLVQQLSTDLTQDTHLKCQYIEECLINLDKTNTTTRVNLPLVVGEVRKHLSNFLLSHPGHPLSGRITLILMAADNLLL